MSYEQVQDLSWEERERILRLLFSKINNPAQQAFVADLPPHSMHPPKSEEAATPVGRLRGIRTEAGPAALV
jgi:hypothetical protein